MLRITNVWKTWFIKRQNLGDKTCYDHVLKIDLTCIWSSDDVTLFGCNNWQEFIFQKGTLIIKFAMPSYKFHAI